jgi:hypothetical protein
VPDGDTVLKVSVNGEATGQNLFIPVRAGN